LLLKSVYIVNIGLFLFGMGWISWKQVNGSYQCQEIMVDFGDDVWEGALMRGASGELTERTLVFSTFNGVYVQHGTDRGRPVYKEMSKLDKTEPFAFFPSAEIRYDGEAWIFTHPDISKSENEQSPWLLRSEPTEEYDLLKVGRAWNIWRGVISNTQMTYSCLSCSSDTDCNLNGECIDGECHCSKNEETGMAKFLGPHCEVKLKEDCGLIVAETQNSRWTTVPMSSTELLQQYNRPIYSLADDPKELNITNDINWLVFTGRRWIYVGLDTVAMNMTFGDIVVAVVNYHAFWSEGFSLDSPTLIALSDPTTGDTPVGVDWYLIGERGTQFGPFGALYPMQKDGLEGRGLFGCNGTGIDLWGVLGDTAVAPSPDDTTVMSTLDGTTETTTPENTNATASLTNATAG
jgi:hypothetical protein